VSQLAIIGADRESLNEVGLLDSHKDKPAGRLNHDRTRVISGPNLLNQTQRARGCIDRQNGDPVGRKEILVAHVSEATRWIDRDGPGTTSRIDRRAHAAEQSCCAVDLDPDYSR